MDLGCILVHLVDNVGRAAWQINLGRNSTCLVFLVLIDRAGRLIGEIGSAACRVRLFFEGRSGLRLAILVVATFDCSVVLGIHVLDM